MYTNILYFGTVFLFFVSAITPMTLGHNVRATDKETIVENTNFDRYRYPESYDCYNADEIFDYGSNYDFESGTNYVNVDLEKVVNLEEPTKPLDGPMNSPWPMYCHDIRHTGRSPYSTADNPGFKKWEFYHPDSVESGIAVADDGTIYYGCGELYAVHSNGTLKWIYDVSGWIGGCCPTIDEDGIIYIGTVGAISRYFYAINPNGTLKWRHELPGSVYSSPAISDDGTIYFGTEDQNIYALYPNGTLKWKYTTGDVVLSSPAIGGDGTIYCGSHDTYLYALYPNNGTLKWKYKTGHWIRTSPCIADDGTIYVVSLDNYLHAVNPDGSLKWKTNMGEGGTSPTISLDGTIYAGYRTLHAIFPNNGSVKWTFDVGGTMRGGTPCNSIDGTIYVGTSNSGEIIAVDPDGTEKWRKDIGTCDSPPAIGEDGTVYIGSRGINDGILHAFGKLDPNAPSEPQINGQTSGKPGTEYDYTFKSTSPLDKDVYYWIEWGDSNIEEWIGPFGSGEIVTRGHTWSDQGTYMIRARAKDTDNLWGPWGELEVTMPRNKAANSPFLRLIEQFPILGEVLLRLIPK